MAMTRTTTPFTAKCGWCEKNFTSTSAAQLGAMRANLAVYCCKSCRYAMANDRSKDAHILGPCPTCGKMFTSHYKGKIYCNMKCYTTSDAFRQRMIAANDAKRIDPKTCPQCGKQFQVRTKKYCSATCRREYFAARFDRWIASPQQVALPQNFDEYMLKDTLPCLIPGCDWEGENLGNHVNFTHGITADQFRELVGFNVGTGLVGAALKEHMASRMRDAIAKGLAPAFDGNQRRPDLQSHSSPRLEAKEHGAKARALLVNTTSKREPRPCRVCGQSVEQSYTGRKLYCSTVCRSKYYSRAKYGELPCDYCGGVFMASRSQIHRARRREKVCCSINCRNRMNIVAALASRGIAHGAVAAAGKE
jgi:hypothetical protein